MCNTRKSQKHEDDDSPPTSPVATAISSAANPGTAGPTVASGFSVTLDESHVERNFTHYLAVFIWIGWMTLFFHFMLSLPFLVYYRQTTILALLIGPMIISALYTIDRKKQPKWSMDLGEWTMKKAAGYFHMKRVVEDKAALESSGPAIFALEPHHVLPLSIFAFNDFLKGFDGHKCIGCVTGACFKIPIMRHVYTWVNASSVDKKNVTKLLDQGHSPVICPGGVQEVTLMENDSECVLYLKKRLGFIKLALIYGYPLVPVFSFGLQNSFNYISPRGKWMAYLGRKLGFLPMAFFGVFGLPLGPSKPVDYVNVVGKPITVSKIDNPTENDLRKYQEIYISEISRIYEENKGKYGMKDVTLRIA